MISFTGQKSKELIKKIQGHETSPQTLKNLFSPEEIRRLIEIKDECFLNAENTSEKLLTKDRGPLGKMAHLTADLKGEVEELVRKKIESFVFGNFEMAFTFHRNYFPYGIHTDAAYDSQEYLYKQGIIPLEVFPKNQSVYTIIFKQKCYHPISYPRQVETINSLSSEEIGTIAHLSKDYLIHDSQLNKYWQGSLADKAWLKGFEISLPFEWVLGDMALWDRSHLHCSSDFENHGIDGKVGLMWVSKKIESR